VTRFHSHDSTGLREILGIWKSYHLLVSLRSTTYNLENIQRTVLSDYNFRRMLPYTRIDVPYAQNATSASNLVCFVLRKPIS